MKVWKARFYDGSFGAMLSWHANRRSAEQWLRALQGDRNDEPQGPEGVEQIDIHTDKAGLIRWLNYNLNTDNG